MIEIEKSKTGLPIMKIEGRLVNSSYDPMTEAQNWLAGVSARIRDYDVIFLLGIGSIYHCLALQNSFPNKKIVVLETDPQLIKTSLELLSDLKKIQICQIADAKDLLIIPEVMSLTEEIFCTLRLPSTRFSNKALFDDLETILTGRSTY